MSERRFVIYEVMQPELNTAFELLPGFVTESELGDRLTAILAILSGDYPTPYKLDKAICVMLHGKKQPLLTPQEAAQFKQAEVDRLSDELSKNHCAPSPATHGGSHDTDRDREYQQRFRH